MARADLIGYTYNKGARPEHRGGFPNRFEIGFHNLTKDEAAETLLFLAHLQTKRAAMQATTTKPAAFDTAAQAVAAATVTPADQQIMDLTLDALEARNRQQL